MRNSERGKATETVTTVDELIKMSSPALLHTLDLLLTHGEFMNTISAGIVLVNSSFVLTISTSLDYTFRHAQLNAKNSFVEYISIVLLLLQVHSICFMTIRFAFYQLECIRSIHFLRGGFACGNISELVGRAGVGKSQLALQLCIMAARYNHQTSIYIDTEQKLSIARLQEMASHRNQESSLQESSHAPF